MSFFRDLTSKPKLKCKQITFSFKLNGLVGEELKIKFTKSKFYCLSKNERKLSYLNWKYTFCSHSAGLLLVDLDDIVLLHLERLRSFIIIDSAAVEEKPGNKECCERYSYKVEIDLPERCDGDSNSLSVGLLQLAHLSGLLHSEVDLIAVLADNLQLDVLGIFSHCWWQGKSVDPLKMATCLLRSGRDSQDGSNWTLL